MRILRVADVTDNRTGGMSRAMYSAGDEMVRLGHTVDYLFSNRLGSIKSPRLRKFVIPVKIPHVVRQLMREQGPYDIVEVHEPLSGWYGLTRNWGRGLPALVGFSHGLECRAHEARIRYKRSKGLPVTVRERIVPYSVIWQANFGLRRCDQVICLNSEDESQLLKMGLPATHVTQARSGVDDVFLQAGRELKTAPDRNRLLFFGSWIERKGILDLVPAVTEILQKYTGAKLTVAGCGQSEEAVKNSFPPHLQQQIQVIPRVAGDAEIVRLYSQHGVLVLPSYFEGQPLVMLEAAAMKLAIVATNLCGMKDFIQDGRNGLLVNPGDPAGITNRLEQLLVNWNWAHQLGEAAHKTALEHKWSQVAKEILLAYETAIHNKRGAKTVQSEQETSPARLESVSDFLRAKKSCRPC